MKYLELECEDGSTCVKTVCDICGAVAKYVHGWNREWADNYYGVANTTVSMVNGTAYPEGSDYVTTEFDICVACFRDKLMPWLAAQGAKIPLTLARFIAQTYYPR